MRKAAYSIPTKWLKKIKVGDYGIYRFSRSTFKSTQTKTTATFNVPSGVNVTFWPRRIYDRIYGTGRISRVAKWVTFVFVFQRSDKLLNVKKQKNKKKEISPSNRRAREKFVRKRAARDRRIIIANAIMRIERHEEYVYSREVALTGHRRRPIKKSKLSLVDYCVNKSKIIIQKPCRCQFSGKTKLIDVYVYTYLYGDVKLFRKWE